MRDSQSSNNRAPVTGEPETRSAGGLQEEKEPCYEGLPAPHHKTGAEIEKDLINAGKTPGLKKGGPEHHEPGEEDESGNKVHHRTTLGRLLHGEHNAMNEEY
ncbi:hypothetical protein LTR50_007436 [Elasticomyces elasticus]|nr:hypothetical protein LTR50_007436 [Elasticomyces elasticus]